MSSLINKSQCQRLNRVWQDFKIVINTLPAAETVLLLFHTNNLLSQLENSSIDQNYIATITERVNYLAEKNPFIFELSDVLRLINETLALINNEIAYIN